MIRCSEEIIHVDDEREVNDIMDTYHKFNKINTKF